MLEAGGERPCGNAMMFCFCLAASSRTQHPLTVSNFFLLPVMSLAERAQTGPGSGSFTNPFSSVDVGLRPEVIDLCSAGDE